jgi:hypothetical protein
MMSNVHDAWFLSKAVGAWEAMKLGPMCRATSRTLHAREPAIEPCDADSIYANALVTCRRVSLVPKVCIGSSGASCNTPDG